MEFAMPPDANRPETAPMVQEEAKSGSEADLKPRPEWQPRFAGSGRLAGKSAIITGADSGIGRAIAALFAREGANIAIVYLLEEGDAAETQRIVAAGYRQGSLDQAL